MMQAARSAAYARSVAQATNLSMAGAWAERAAASVALDSSDPAAAATQALASAASADAAGDPVEAALSRTMASGAIGRPATRAPIARPASCPLAARTTRASGSAVWISAGRRKATG